MRLTEIHPLALDIFMIIIIITPFNQNGKLNATEMEEMTEKKENNSRNDRLSTRHRSHPADCWQKRWKAPEKKLTE